jgi:hypothetical protein
LVSALPAFLYHSVAPALVLLVASSVSASSMAWDPESGRALVGASALVLDGVCGAQMALALGTLWGGVSAGGSALRLLARWSETRLAPQ